ncbi:hypothetical protein ACFQX7_30175 [Luedemannella flava]
MVWWLVGGLVLIGLVLLGVVTAPVLRRLAQLRSAGVRLREQAEAAQALQPGVEALIERAAGLEAALAHAADAPRPPGGRKIRNCFGWLTLAI